MLICMKPSREEIGDLRKRLRSARKKKRLTDTEIGRLAGVHPSQVGRILRGDFRTLSHNVVQVCRVLGIELATVATAADTRDAAWSRLEESVRKLWDETPEGARKIAKMIEAIAELGPDRRG